MPYPNTEQVGPYDLLAALNQLSPHLTPQDILNQVSALLAELQPNNYEAQTMRDSYLAQANNQYPLVIQNLVEPGNLDLYNRPVLNNFEVPYAASPSYSTTSSMSFNDGQNEVIIPTVVGTENGQVVRLSPEQAEEHYYRTGQHLGKFKPDNWQIPDDYGQRLHEIQERRIADHNGQPFRQ